MTASTQAQSKRQSSKAGAAASSLVVNDYVSQAEPTSSIYQPTKLVYQPHSEARSQTAFGAKHPKQKSDILVMQMRDSIESQGTDLNSIRHRQQQFEHNMAGRNTAQGHYLE